MLPQFTPSSNSSKNRSGHFSDSKKNKNNIPLKPRKRFKLYYLRCLQNLKKITLKN